MIEECDSTHFNVAVVATMSSGKSTLLNAMLGCPLLPSKNEACTAKVFKLVDVDGLTAFRCRAKSSNNGHAWQEAGQETLHALNESDASEIEIHGDFPHIANHRAKLCISFYDTPGPNNSRNASHAEITNSILRSSDCGFLVCVLNATQLGVNDESSLLSSIMDKIKLPSGTTKIVFAVNKIDCLDLERGETPQDLIKTAKGYLRDLGFFQPVVIPTMSCLSLVIRRVLAQAHQLDEVDLSPRAQRKLLRNLSTVRRFAPFYRKAILHTPRYKRFWAEALAQERPYAEIGKVRIADRSIAVRDLIEADILTGIPILEECMEIELLKFAAARKEGARNAEC